VVISDACRHAATSEPLTQEHFAFLNQTDRQQHCDSLYTRVPSELEKYQAPSFPLKIKVSVYSRYIILAPNSAFLSSTKVIMNTLWSLFGKGNKDNQTENIESENNNGFPVPNHTLSYWRSELHPIDSYCSSEKLPSSCDIAIIGAGMTGVSTAYHLSRLHAANNSGKKPSIVILDAREVCSGATGRNGVC
jgi:hypothetical protein